MNVIKIFKSEWLKRSSGYVKNPAKMKKLAEEALEFADNGGLEGVTGYVKVMGRYIKAVANGSYKGYSKSKLALAVAALVYLVVPTDLMPDFIPLTGYLDDMTVITFAIKQLRDEIERFKASCEEPPLEDVSPIPSEEEGE